MQRKFSDKVDNFYIPNANIKGTRFYIVRVGPFEKKLGAENARRRLKSIKGVKWFISKEQVKPKKHQYSIQVGAMRHFKNTKRLKKILSDEVRNCYIFKWIVKERITTELELVLLKINWMRKELETGRKTSTPQKVLLFTQILEHIDMILLKTIRQFVKRILMTLYHLLKFPIETGSIGWQEELGTICPRKVLISYASQMRILLIIKKTVIYFLRGFRDKAIYLENQFPDNQIIKKIQNNSTPLIPIKIIIGDDIQAHDGKLFVKNF